MSWLRRSLGAVLLGLACLAAPALAQDVVRDSIPLAGKVIPLPPGDWVRLVEGWGRVDGEQPAPYGAIRAVVLGQVRDGRLDAMALVATNELPVDAGWGVPAACESGAFTTGVRSSARNIACGFAAVLPPDAAAMTSLPAWRLAQAQAARRGLALPPGLAVAGARVGDRRDVIEARFAFAPERFGLAPGAPIVADGALAGWTRQMEARMEAALASSAPALPPLAPAVPVAGVAAAASTEMPAWQLGLYKLATNRIMQTAISFGIGMLLTADTYASTSLALWQSATHSLVYYGNELAWEWPRTPARMDFVAEAGRWGG